MGDGTGKVPACNLKDQLFYGLGSLAAAHDM